MEQPESAILELANTNLIVTVTNRKGSEEWKIRQLNQLIIKPFEKIAIRNVKIS
jgi:hypothetical protein